MTDAEIRAAVYRAFVETGAPPDLGPEALPALRRLAAAHAVVLDAGGERIRRALPFSAVPTPYRVTSGARRWWANCAWDALGIPALLECDAVVEDLGDAHRAPRTLRVESGALLEEDGLVHVSVPAAHWWDDVDFT